MKKKFFLVGVIVTMGFGAFLVSCSKDDDGGSKTCSCQESDYSGYNATRNVSPSSYGAANCADLELKLRQQAGGEYNYSCH